MNAEYAGEKLTDELERKLIQRELDHGPRGGDPTRASVMALEIVVGTLLVLGVLLLAARFT